MNKQVNFEDAIFILNVRIRMIRTLLQLDTDPAIFLKQTMKDLEFIDSALETLTEKFLANKKFHDREAEAENLSDAEWQLSQLIYEIGNNKGPLSFLKYPEVRNLLEKIKKSSEKRHKLIDDSCTPTDGIQAEPLVSNAELNGLLAQIEI